MGGGFNPLSCISQSRRDAHQQSREAQNSNFCFPCFARAHPLQGVRKENAINSQTQTVSPLEGGGDISQTEM